MSGITHVRRGGLAAQPTPLEEVRLRVNSIERRLRLKLEGANPAGSIKDRTARGLFASIPESKLRAPRATLVESTSGNLGVALAMLARRRAIRFIAVTDPNATFELRMRLLWLGAEVVVVQRPDPVGGFLQARLRAVAELLEESPRLIWTNQYENPANPLMHYLETGPELHRQAAQRVQTLFAPVSTGGTFAGLAQFFREARPALELVAVDVHGSVAIRSGNASPRHLPGLGASRPSSFVKPWHHDAVVQVSEADAVRWCRAFDRATGLRLGASSGAVLAACLQRMAEVPTLRDAICVCPDLGDSYLTTVYDDTWLDRDGWSHAHTDGPAIDVVFDNQPAWS